MTLTQLKIFAAVAEFSHATRAAEKLHITQSAVSAAISALEKQHKIKLFNRVGRAIELSEVGRIFLEHAHDLLERAQAAERALDALGGRTIGQLEIAASQTIANYWLPRRLAAFHDVYPGINLNISIGNTRDVENLVDAGNADIGFVEGSIRSNKLKLDEVDQDQPVMVIQFRRWPSLGRGTRPIDLTSVPWVVREPGSGTRGILEKLAADGGLSWSDLNIILELSSNEAVREAVVAGIGAAVLSQHVVATAIEAELLRALPLNMPPRKFMMVRRSKTNPSDTQTALIDMVLGRR
jgi:DNA-binding transcriptional LysR family regulator